MSSLTASLLLKGHCLNSFLMSSSYLPHFLNATARMKKFLVSHFFRASIAMEEKVFVNEFAAHA